MRKKYFFCITIVAILLLITGISSAFKRGEDQCTEWQRSNAHNIEFRWCKDPSMFNSTTYQFHNGYSFKVWYYFRIDYTNGESFTGNTILDPGEDSGKGSMYKRTPRVWTITKKQKKDASGRWTDF